MILNKVALSLLDLFIYLFILAFILEFLTVLKEIQGITVLDQEFNDGWYIHFPTN